MKQKNWNGKTVLIIDDSEEEASAISKILKEVGFYCIYASDGQKGIDIAHQNHPDVILMDWNMPGINGHEVLEELKTAKDTRMIPIIIITGSSLSNGELCFALCDKADDYLRKPIDRFELIGRIAANMRLYRVINIVQERSERLAQLSYTLQEAKK
ncbi:MAG: response regulator [Flammeovirgaceae bacterium]